MTRPPTGERAFSGSALSKIYRTGETEVHASLEALAQANRELRATIIIITHNAGNAARRSPPEAQYFSRLTALHSRRRNQREVAD